MISVEFIAKPVYGHGLTGNGSHRPKRLPAESRRLERNRTFLLKLPNDAETFGQYRFQGKMRGRVPV
jgi:hypothetical protein